MILSRAFRGQQSMKRVVITGIGITSGIGNEINTFTRNLKEMKSGISKVETFDTSKYRLDIASNVKGLSKFLKPSERRLPRPVQFALNATRNALLMSGVQDFIPSTKIGCFVSGAGCEVFESEAYYRKYLAGEYETLNASSIYSLHWDNLVSEISRRFNLCGPRNTVLTACSSSGIAIGLGHDLIKIGEMDAMVVGGSDGYSEFTYSGFQALNSASNQPCRPFDKDRDGLTFGEGSGILILENYELAKKRGANILAEIVGYGAIGEGYHLTAPHPEGIGYKKCISMALNMAKIDASKISHINSHGTATPLNDVIESESIRTIFKHDKKLLVNSIKSLVGHCMGAAGAVEAVNCVLNLMYQFVPGTCNLKKIDPNISINIRSVTSDVKLEYILSNSAGFGGNNSSILLKKFVA